MGFNLYNNVVAHDLSINYNVYDPFGNYNRGGGYLGIFQTSLYNNGAFADFSIYHELYLITKKFNAYGYSIYVEPVKNHDYWATPEEGRYYITPESYNFGAWYSSDYRKVFAFDLRSNYRTFNSDQYRFNLSFSPRVRISDKASLILD